MLLTGTLAIDHLGDYPGTFAALPRHPGINLAVQIDKLARRFGGCAMNIAYSLRLLGEDPAPFVFVGADFGADYAAHLEALRMDSSGITTTAAPHCAHAFLFTDRQGSQFTAFFPGPAVPTDYAARLARFAAAGAFEFAVPAPDLPANMLAAAAALRVAGIPRLRAWASLKRQRLRPADPSGPHFPRLRAWASLKPTAQPLGGQCHDHPPMIPNPPPSGSFLVGQAGLSCCQQ